MPVKGKKQSPEHIAKRMAAIDWSNRLPGAGRPANSPEVLWSKVSRGQQHECWPWKGFKNQDGYGRTWIGDKGYYAHRVIFDLANPGVITRSAPSNKKGFGIIRHTCDNPSCCNPGHMIVGTQQDNVGDMHRRKRAANFEGVRSSTAKLTEEEVREIRLMKKTGATINALAMLYEVSRATISGLLYGRHYQDVD